jgi:hypothetical protein
MTQLLRFRPGTGGACSGCSSGRASTFDGGQQKASSKYLSSARSSFRNAGVKGEVVGFNDLLFVMRCRPLAEISL